MKEDISIIIPTYTAYKYLDLCLESIWLNQNNAHNEIVIVVDGTKDISYHIIEKYLDKINIKPVIFEENRGLALATNYGVYNSTNKLCLILNDDNVCPKNFDKILLDLYNNINPNDNFCLLVPNQIEPRNSIFDPFIIKDFGDLKDFNLETFTSTEITLRNNEILRDKGWTFPLFLEKELFLSVGGFDPMFDSPHVIDWEFFIKLDKLKIPNYRTTHLNFYHFGSKSARSLHSYEKEIQAHEYFGYKWGHKAYNKLLT